MGSHLLTAALAGLAGCTPAPRVTIRAPDPDLPLVRLVDVHAERPVEVEVRATDGTRDTVVRSVAATDHELPLLRLGVGTWEIEVRADDRVVATASLEVAPLPGPFPDLVLHAWDPARASPGDTLFGIDGPVHWSVVVDPEGEVVWAWRHPHRLVELQLTDEGLLLGVEEQDGGPFERTWTGERVRRFLPVDRAGPRDVAVDVRLFHHDVQPLPDGSLLALTNDAVEPVWFPTSYTDRERGSTHEVVRVDRAVVVGADGAVLESWPLDERLSMTRLGYDALDEASGERNWSHANGVVAHDDALLVSSRNQDALVAIDRDTGRTRWILANPANWPDDLEALRLRPSGEVRWPYHQHAPEWNGDEVMVFDNGNHQASPWTGEPDLPAAQTASRVAAFRVDEAAGTVEEAWSFEHPEHRFSCPWLGDADRLPGGTVLADFAAVRFVDGRPTREVTHRGSELARLVEFVPETGEVVWDLEIVGTERDPEAWSSVRAQRIDGWADQAGPEGTAKADSR